MALSGPSPQWDDEGWREHAACRRTDAELFFPSGNRAGVADDQVAAAKAICRVCQVQEACLNYAFETNQESGIWGGREEDERRRLRKIWRAGRRPSVRSART